MQTSCEYIRIKKIIRSGAYLYSSVRANEIHFCYTQNCVLDTIEHLSCSNRV